VGFTRRSLLKTPLLAPLAASAADRIDRPALLARHNPHQTAIDAFSPLSVGNGEFAFTCDVTGLQTFPEAYEAGIPLCTQSQWGWHSRPAPAGLGAVDYRLREYDTHGRMVGYPTSSEGQKPLYDWLRENPHRLNLARVAFRLKRKSGELAQASDLSAINQTLHLERGLIESRFQFDGAPVHVETACDPELDCLAVSVESALIANGRLEIVIEFPYGSPAINASDFTSVTLHRTSLAGRTFEREMDGTRYSVAVAWTGPAQLAQEAPHRFVLKPAKGAPNLLLSCHFRQPGQAGAVGNVMERSASHWREFWSRGGCVDFSGSTDPRAKELERRVVLSQYLTAIQCAGSLPPQETGLTCNSWYGKFHLEMHWWHAVHFAYWNRLELLEKSLGYYDRILDKARAWARRQGYPGARWPKMTDASGIDSPSPIGPLLIWQQPHPIYYAELCRQARPGRATLDRYRNIVLETAEFMASFAWLDSARGKYVLGPPVIPAQENHPPLETWNPTFELEYWRWALETAQQWRVELGLGREPKWDDVVKRLSPLPVKDGVYLAHENCPQTYTERNRDHPSMLAALGVLPGVLADKETMRRTLKKVMAEWRWADTWGWDYPMVAMTAARLGEPAMAVDALLKETPKNRYLPNGHNYQRPGLHLYLPGNGGLLTAIALMAAGWQGGPDKPAPGFPARGWQVRAENLRRVI
jgi:hypothetical protein